MVVFVKSSTTLSFNGQNMSKRDRITQSVEACLSLRLSAYGPMCVCVPNGRVRTLRIVWSYRLHNFS